jgi:hypothetical protein
VAPTIARSSPRAACANRSPSARDLRARDERQLGRGEVLVAALVGVGEVDPGARDADQHLAVAGLGDRHVVEPEHLRATELLHLDRAHGARTLPAVGRYGDAPQ